MDTLNLWKAGFFNYLREDITFGLMNRRALKIDLANTHIPDTALDDEDQLNIGALYLAEAVNLRFQEMYSQQATQQLEQRFERWRSSLPDQFTPFHDSSIESPYDAFPTIRCLRDCHVATAQYCLVTESLLCEARETHHNTSKPESSLNANAIRLCGMAFTSNTPAVLVNSFGPISYCGRHISSRVLQADLIRRLHACGKETGWTVQRIIDELSKSWDGAFSQHGRIPPHHATDKLTALG